MHRLLRLIALIPCCALGAGALAQTASGQETAATRSQAQPSAAAPPAPPTPAAGASAGPEAATDKVIPGRSDDELRTLDTTDGDFTVRIRTTQRAHASGTLLMLSLGDGDSATGSALERLRRDLPAHGWTTWCVPLDAPPWAHAQHPGAVPEEADVPVQTMDTQRHAELERWMTHGRNRLQAAMTALHDPGSGVVLVAAGPAALLVPGAPARLAGVLLIEPFDHPDLPATLPTAAPVPLMEILSPALAAQRSPPAGQPAGESAHHRRLILDGASPEPFGVETLLTRRVRGWLTALASPATRPPGAD